MSGRAPASVGHSDFHTLKGYRLGLCSFNFLYDRSAVEGFGEVPRYSCVCGWLGQTEPDVVHTQKASWGYWGGDPDIYEYRCPACGSEECGEHEDPDLSFKVKRRYRTPIMGRK